MESLGYLQEKKLKLKFTLPLLELIFFNFREPVISCLRE
jgi:hypothetical protein